MFRSPGGRIQPPAQSAPGSGGRLWPFGLTFCPRLVWCAFRALAAQRETCLGSHPHGTIRDRADGFVPRDAAAVPEQQNRAADRAARRVAGPPAGGRPGQGPRTGSRRRDDHFRRLEARTSTLIRENTETHPSSPSTPSGDQMCVHTALLSGAVVAPVHAPRVHVRLRRPPRAAAPDRSRARRRSRACTCRR